MCYYNFFKFPI